MSVKYWVVIFLIWTNTAPAAEIVWLKLTPYFSYRDITTHCTTVHFPSVFYFSAEVDGDRVLRAALKDDTFEVLADRIYFHPSEVVGIRMYRDPAGQLWLKGLPLSVRLLSWAFRNAGQSLDQCVPPQKLRSVSPTPFPFVFDTERLGESVFDALSTHGKFSGHRADGSPYQAELRFYQKRMR